VQIDVSATERMLQRHVDLSLFGKGKAKSLADLLEEVANGETTLSEENGRIVRRISVITINVFVDLNGDRYCLVEDRQIFDDGRERRRNLPSSLSEKIHQNEDVLTAVSRALQEEIGVNEFTLLIPNPHKRIERNESPSFPGIFSEYTLHGVDVVISPSEYKEKYQEREKDLVTHFKWVRVKKEE